MKSFHHACFGIRLTLACVVCGLLSGCNEPLIPGMRYQSTVSAPVTDSIQQAYTDIFDEMWEDTKEIVAMDRYRHGIRPTRDIIPVQTASAEASFDRYDSMYFKVYAIEVIDQYKAPISMDYREHLPVDTSEAVHSWANRLRPTGGVNKLQVVIKDAPILNASTEGGNKRYNASLTVEMRICARDGTVLATISSLTAQSSADIGGMAGVDSRKAALNHMLARLIDSINGDLENKMARNFSPYIDRSKAS